MAEETKINTRNAIIQAYNCFDFDCPTESNINEEQLINILSEYLNNLIDHNINDVLNVLYRIDVDENKVKEILFGSNNKYSIGKSLAILIIDRQKQKLFYRQKFG